MAIEKNGPFYQKQKYETSDDERKAENDKIKKKIKAIND